MKFPDSAVAHKHLDGRRRRRAPVARPISVGDKHGALVVVTVLSGGVVECRCDCGGVWSGKKYDLLRGFVLSCGCRKRKTTIERNRRHGEAARGHQTSEYLIWKGMKKRCYSKNEPSFRVYGGRGIIVCDRWRESYVNFLTDMGPRPSPRHSIDRYPNRDGNYDPSNCRWATIQEQGQNTRRTRLTPEAVVEIRSTPRTRKTGAALARRFGVSRSTIQFVIDRRTWRNVA